MADDEGTTDRRQAARDGFQLATAKVVRALLAQREQLGEEASVSWLTDTTNIPSATMTRILAGRTSASLTNLAEIGAAFDLSLAELVEMIEATVAKALEISANQLGDEDEEAVGDATAAKASWLGAALSSPVTKGVIGGAAGLAAGLVLKAWWERR